MKLLNILCLGLVILFASSAYSQVSNKVNPNGYNKFYYGDGKQVSSEGPMRDGKPDGYWKTYYINGQIKSEGNRKDFKLDSIWVFYDEMGNITKKISYKNDKRNGHYEVFKLLKDSVGRNVMVSKELYIDDLKQGKSYYFYDNAAVHFETHYLDNRKHGSGLEYDRNGTIITELRYRNDVTISKLRINRYDRNGEKTGTWKYFHDNGKVKTEAYYKNGKINGYLKEYSDKGKLLSSKRYIDGQLYVPKEEELEKAVVKKEFFENGRVKSSGSFIENKPVGQHTTYTKSGKVKETKKYSSKGSILSNGVVDKKGKRQGDWTYYYLSGKVKSTGKYKNNRRIGKWDFYHENGKKEQEGQYNKRGRAEGLWKWYHDNGNILREEEFEGGKENGQLVEYARNGDIIAKGNFIDGLKEGEWYYKVGDEIQEGSYKADYKDGKWTHYFPDKTKKFEGSYIDGEEQGKHKYYYENGKIKMEGEFSMGKRHNQWKFYDEEGFVRTTITYRLDEEIKIDGTKLADKKK